MKVTCFPVLGKHLHWLDFIVSEWHVCVCVCACAWACGVFTESKNYKSMLRYHWLWSVSTFHNFIHNEEEKIHREPNSSPVSFVFAVWDAGFILLGFLQWTHERPGFCGVYSHSLYNHSTYHCPRYWSPNVTRLQQLLETFLALVLLLFYLWLSWLDFGEHALGVWEQMSDTKHFCSGVVDVPHVSLLKETGFPSHSHCKGQFSCYRLCKSAIFFSKNEFFLVLLNLSFQQHQAHQVKIIR